ncbi:STAS domain-containing protein [Nonomuraea sp. NPDC049152]|uniref:STAS domain-containing protein n=1 Tax=Nonomuraea sp. NPDC049152 TaxID=3154350 RepID=UPI0034098DF2
MLLLSGRSRRDAIVDLPDVTSMDASGLTAPIRADDQARLLGGRSHLVNLPDRIAHILRISELDRRFAE